VALGVSKNIMPVQAGISFSETLAIVCFPMIAPRCPMGTRCLSLEITNLIFFLKGQQFLVLGGELDWILACAALHLAGPLCGSSPCPRALSYTFIWAIEIHNLEEYFCLGIFCFPSKGCSFTGRSRKIANHS
jgi:hypothetical protein